MTELSFLELIHGDAIKDSYGWSEHVIGPYLLHTNGVAFTAVNVETRRKVRLQYPLCYKLYGASHAL
jgi:cytidine deaminase